MAGVGRAAVSGPGQGGCFTPATALEQMHDMPVAVSCPDRRQGEWMQVTLLGDVTGGSHSASCQVLKPALCEEREPRTQNPATLREESGTHSAHTPAAARALRKPSTQQTGLGVDVRGRSGRAHPVTNYVSGTSAQRLHLQFYGILKSLARSDLNWGD